MAVLFELTLVSRFAQRSANYLSRSASLDLGAYTV